MIGLGELTMGGDHYTPLVLTPGMVTTNVGGNPLITAVVSTNTLHPQYTKIAL